MSLATEIAGRFLRLPEPATRDVVVERDLPVHMSDGVVLLADRHHPRGGNGGLPTVLVRSPYGRRGAYGLLYGRLLAERGFQVVVQSVRGTFSSGGRLDPFDERADGLATVAWLRRQPWYGGTFGTAGPSYLGNAQWALAPEAGSELRAMAPSITASEFRSHTYGGEAFSLESAVGWTMTIKLQETFLGPLRQFVALRRKLPALMDHLPLRDLDRMAVGETVHFFQEWLEHDEPDDPYWQRRDASATVGEADAPVSIVTGWHDIFLPWTLRDHRVLRAAGRDVQLTIGPWGHLAPDLLRESVGQTLAWLRAHLLGDRRLLHQAPVRFFVSGADEWRTAGEWPPPGARPERWHLRAAGGLSREAPIEAGAGTYRYDPADPTPSVAGPSLTDLSRPKDNRPLESRADVLTFTSTPMEEDLEAIGPVSAELWLRSTLEHFDVFVRLCDVDPSGRSVNVCDAIRRIVPMRPEPEADGVRRVDVDLWPTAHRFARGHRLRIVVASGAHPRYARNTGTGEPLATATTLRAGEQTVLHSPDRPSAIVLPVAALAVGDS